jgi:hypothetical protein
MEPATHRRLTPAEGRKFAFTLAFGFAVLATLLLWRGRSLAPSVFFAVAGLLGVAGLVAPSRLAPISRGWNALGAALSRITSPVFFTVIYMVVVAPIGLVRRTFGNSPLARDPNARSYWIRRAPADPAATRAALERQF